MRPEWLIRALALLAMAPGVAAAGNSASPGWVEVSAIFTERCVMCHSAVAGASKGLRLDDYASALLGSERRERLLAGAGAAALAVALAAYLGFGWNWLHAFGLAGENQGRTSHMSIPVTFARLTGLDPGAVRAAALLLYAAALAYLLAWTARGGDWVRAAAWAGFGLLLATSWLLPWYLVWALPLVAVSRDRTLQLLALALTAYQLGARIPL